MFRIGDLESAEVWQIADQENIRQQGSRDPVEERVDLPAAAILRIEPLDLDYDDRPPRHVSIVGWPDAEAEQIALAQKLIDDKVPEEFRPKHRKRSL